MQATMAACAAAFLAPRVPPGALRPSFPLLFSRAPRIPSIEGARVGLEVRKWEEMRGERGRRKQFEKHLC